MFNKVISISMIVAVLFLTGCASVPMASVEEDKAKKEFKLPPQESAGLYIYRNSNFGAALKKTVTVDGKVIGETAPMTYFYRDIQPGSHSLSTESEFSDNAMKFEAKGGKNYFVRQYIKMGVFVGGANFEMVSEEEGKKGVLECNLAQPQDAVALEQGNKHSMK